MRTLDTKEKINPDCQSSHITLAEMQKYEKKFGELESLIREAAELKLRAQAAEDIAVKIEIEFSLGPVDPIIVRKYIREQIAKRLAELKKEKK